MPEEYKRIGYFSNKIVYSNSKGNFIIRYNNKKLILLNQQELSEIENRLGDLEKNLLKGEFEVKENSRNYFIDLRGNVVFKNPYKGKDADKEADIRKDSLNHE